MVHVRIKRNTRGAIVGFFASGHAEFAPKGEDIVCAAVSALTQTAVLGLHCHVGIEADITRDDDAGELRCILPTSLSESKALRAQIILETMCTGLQAIAEQYGAFVQLKEVTRDVPHEFAAFRNEKGRREHA